jgi:hypothetical protein
MDTLKKNIKTIAQGALGGLTFGMYHMYISLKQIEEHNEKMAVFYKNIECLKNIKKD